jgi:hypothetical protein
MADISDAHLARTGRARPTGWADDASIERTPAESVDAEDILERLATLPVVEWRYHWEPATIRHIGPSPEDVIAAFGLDSDARYLNLLDANGILVASVQALLEQLHRLQGRVAELEIQRDGRIATPELTP